MVKGFIETLLECVAATNGSVLFGVILLALALGALCWVGCSFYTKLWNKRFHVRMQHHLLCAVAAALTILFTITYHAVGNLEHIVNGIIDQWGANLAADKKWNNQTYENAFYAVKKQFPDSFIGVPEPGSPDTFIPARNDESHQIVAKTYVNEACGNFSARNPFLGMMLRARPGISEEVIQYDISTFLGNKDNKGKKYPLERTVDIAAKHIREGLLIQSPKTVGKTRLILILLFLAVQMIPFGTIGYCAYKDLSVANTRILKKTSK